MVALIASRSSKASINGIPAMAGESGGKRPHAARR
jgi:hypothetical protein